MTVRSEEIQLQAGDDKAGAYLAIPESGGGPGILVLHAWWGLNPFFRALCDRLAGQGYVVLAPDLNRGKIAKTIDEAKALMSQRDFEFARVVVLAAKDRLLGHPARTGAKLGVMGFSMGAGWSLALAELAPGQVGSVVLYYGVEAVDFTKVKARFLGQFAETDSWEPLEGVKAMEKDMQAAGLDVQFHFYPNVSHWFVEEDRPEYDPAAASLAWQRTLDFLKESL